MTQAQKQDRIEQAPFQFMGQASKGDQAEELLAKLRQSFFLSNSRHNPMRVLALIEDQYPQTEKDCDFLRLSIVMAKDMGNSRVHPMRVLHCDRIAQLIRHKTQTASLNS